MSLLRASAELRYRLTPYIDAIGYLDEGDARVVKRQGGAGQVDPP
jgi:hypothetical protein